MYTGKIIRFFEHRMLVAAVCLWQDGERLGLLCADGSDFVLSTARIVHESGESVDVAAPEESLLDHLRNNIVEQKALVQHIDPCRLWETVAAPGIFFEIHDLARAAFGQTATSAYEAAVLAALVEDHTYFKLHGRMFLAHTAEQVQAQKRKKANEIARQNFIRQGSVWLQAVLAGRECVFEDSAACIEILKDYAALGRESPTWSQVREILQAAGISDQRQCCAVLVQLGVFDADENVLLRRYGIPHQWPAEVVRQVESLGAGAICGAVNDPGRQDLTQLYVCSIDDAFTRDVDDAISFRLDGSSLELGIHITDVAAFVDAGTPIDVEAARRGASLYLPEAKIPMLPPALSENIASFRVGERNPAMSFMMRVSEEGELLEYRIVRSVVRIAERLTYSDVDGSIAQGADMARLYRFAAALRARRCEAGAVLFLLPEMQVRVDRSHDVILKLRERETPSQVLVSEFMILANYCAALFFSEQRQPGLFRRQAEPSQRFIGKDTPSLFAMFLQRRAMSRVEITASPGLHSSLGLAGYTSITSPLRKYLDLVMQRQLVSLLCAGPAAYTRRELREIAFGMQPVLTRLGLVEYERRRYWVLKAMKSREGDILDALVLERSHGLYDLLLPDFMLDVRMKEKDTGMLTPGTTVSARLKCVDPFDGTLELEIFHGGPGHG
jgi:exoribonuclease II